MKNAQSMFDRPCPLNWCKFDIAALARLSKNVPSSSTGILTSVRPNA